MLEILTDLKTKNKMKYEKQFRRDNPESSPEKDPIWDLENYTLWLEEKLYSITESIEYISEEIDQLDPAVHSVHFEIKLKLDKISII